MVNINDYKECPMCGALINKDKIIKETIEGNEEEMCMHCYDKYATSKILKEKLPKLRQVSADIHKTAEGFKEVEKKLEEIKLNRIETEKMLNELLESS